MRKLAFIPLSLFLFAGVVAAEDTPAPFELNMDKVDITHDGKFGESKTYIIPTLYLHVTYKRNATAKDSGIFANAHVFINGLDKPAIQALAKKLYDDLAGKIRAAGYTVLTYDDVKADLAGADRMKPDAGHPFPSKWGDKTKGGHFMFVIATPSDEQTFDYGIAGVMHPYEAIAKSRNAVVLVPEIYFAMPQVEKKKGRGKRGREASVELSPDLTLYRAMVNALPPDLGWANIKVQEHDQRLAAEDVGTLEETHATQSDPNDDYVIGSADFVMDVNPAVLATGVLRVGTAINDLTVKTIKKAH